MNLVAVADSSVSKMNELLALAFAAENYEIADELLVSLVNVLCAANDENFIAFSLAAAFSDMKIPKTDGTTFKIVRAYDLDAKDIQEICAKVHVASPAVYNALDAYRPQWRAKFRIGQ